MRSPMLPLAGLVCVVACSTAAAFGQELPKFPLWETGAPGAVGTEENDKPSLTVFAPPAELANGCAVVVCPGGGYGGLAVDHEGKQIGEWMNARGITAFMLKYRLAPKYRHPTQLGDVQRALRTVRARASEWKIDPKRIGVMGFSAGGHLASSLGTHFDAGNPQAEDKIDQTSCRPDFLILCYAVINLTDDKVTHKGSRSNLLGKEPDPQLVELMSNEKQVTKETPPTFLWHTSEDTAVPPENSVLFYLACRKAGVPVEMHIYEKGRHGIGLAAAHVGAKHWPQELEAWLINRTLISAGK